MEENTKKPSDKVKSNKNKKFYGSILIEAYSKKKAALKAHLDASPGWQKAKKYFSIAFVVATFLAFLFGFIGYAGTHNWNWAHAAQVVFVNALIENFLGLGAILIGFLVFIGYLLMKRGFVDALIGFIKAAIGFIILGIGSGILITTARPIFIALGALNNGGQVVPLDPYFGLASSTEFFKKVGGAAGGLIYLTLVFGFLTNIILVALKRWTNIRTLFVTGHIMIQQSAIFSVVIFLVLFTGNGYSGQSAFWGSAILAGISVGCYWGYGSAVNYYATQKVTENGGFAVGHQQMIAIAIAYKLGRFFGRAENDAENRRLSPAFRIFEDNIFTQSFIIFLVFLILILVIQFTSTSYNSKIWISNNDYAKIKVMQENWDAIKAHTNVVSELTKKGITENSFIANPSQANIETLQSILTSKSLTMIELKSLPADNPFNTYIINPAFSVEIGTQKGNLSAWGNGDTVWWFTGLVLGIFKIVGSILVIVYGVRMFVTELQQSFQGISEKLLPNASVAVDIAATYGYGQNSVTYGFASGTLGQFISVGILIGISRAVPSYPIVIPIFITLFFNSGAIGIFANKSGGVRAAVLLPFIMAFFGIFLSSAGIFGITRAFNEIKASQANLAFNLGTAGATAKDMVSPFSVGYNGMADPNIFFGILNALISLNSKLAYFWVVLWWVLLVALAQLIKYRDDEKQTWAHRFYTKIITKFWNLPFWNKFRDLRNLEKVKLSFKKIKLPLEKVKLSLKKIKLPFKK